MSAGTAIEYLNLAAQAIDAERAIRAVEIGNGYTPPHGYRLICPELEHIDRIADRIRKLVRIVESTL